MPLSSSVAAVKSCFLCLLGRKNSPIVSLRLRDLPLETFVSALGPDSSWSKASGRLPSDTGTIGSSAMLSGMKTSSSSLLKKRLARILDRIRRREDAVASGLSFSRRITSLTAVVTVEEKGEGEMNGLARWLPDLELCDARGVTGRSTEYE